MDDDPAATQARDKEALRNLANELLDLEGERDFRQAIAESLADGNPRDYEKALREYDSAAKTIESKTLEKQRLEQRIRAAKNSARQSTRDATFGEDANMRAARDRWGVGTWIFSFDLLSYCEAYPNCSSFALATYLDFGPRFFK